MREETYFRTIARTLFALEIPMIVLGTAGILIVLDPRTNPILLLPTGIAMLFWVWFRLDVARHRSRKLWYFVTYQKEKQAGRKT